MVLLARKDEEGNTQTLYDHLHGAGRLASGFEDEFADISRTAAVLHDVGKVAQQFQTYLLSDDGHRGDVQHARQGAFVVNDFFESKGEIEDYYCSVLGEENRNVLLRREQFRVADDEQKSLRYAKSFIVGKLYNAKWVLERTKRDHALRVNIDRLAEQSGKLSAALLKARKSLTVDELRGVEGLAAKDYFYAFDDLVLKNKDDFFFTSRSRRPPLDRLNALLSFCYSILTNDCIAALQGVGLDPYVGFMHTDRPGRASLALDLVEEFRPVLADRFVLTLVNTGAVKPGDFEIRENGGVLLSDFGRKKVLTAWQKKKSDQILHPFLQEKISWGLVPYVQALLLARSLRGDLDDYPPFMWK